MKQNTAIAILTGAAFLVAITLLYVLLAPVDRSMLSRMGWMAFGSIAMLLVVAVLAPLIARRLRGTSAPRPLTPADIRFTIAILAILCPLIFWAGSAYGSLLIMLVPISFILRKQNKVTPHDTDL